MANIQVRIPDDLLEEIEKIARSRHTSRSEIVRKLLYEGIEREI
ncbi:MAG: ribbon-helix-helix domain-containing protein [Thermoplasmata archaeon]